MFNNKWKKQLQSAVEISVDLLGLMDKMMQELPEESREKYDLAVKYIVEGRIITKDGKIVGLK